MEKVIEFLMDKKKRYIVVGAFFIIVLLIVLSSCSKPTALEEKSIKDVSKRVMPYMDRIENSKESKLNKFEKCKIIGISDYDLIGEFIN